MTFFPRDQFAAALLDGGGFGHNVLNPAYGGGAAADGGTDDAAAWQAAIDAAAEDGRPVLAPAAPYLIGDTLDVPSNVAVVGVNVRVGTGDALGVRLIRGFSGTLLDFAGTTATRRVGQRLEGVTIVGGDTGGGFTGTAIDVSHTSGFRSADVEVHGNIGAAWRCVQVWDAYFERPWVRRCGDYGVSPAWLIDNDDDETCDTLVILYPHFESNYASHLRIQASGAFGTAPRWCSVIVPKFHGQLQGSGEEHDEPIVDVQDQEDLHILGAQIKANGDDGGALMLGGDRAYCQVNCQGDTVAPLVLLGNASRCVVELNALSTTAPSKIRLDAGASNNRITVTHGAAAAALVDNSGTVNNVVIEAQDGRFHLRRGQLLFANEPVFADGDTTPSVASGSNRFGVNNASPTTITALDNGVEGQLVFLTFFNGNTTMAHSSTLWLQGERNYPAASDDVLVLLRRNTRWQEVTRMQANDSPTYSITNVAVVRSYDAASTDVDTLADALGTLVNDIRARAPWILT